MSRQGTSLIIELDNGRRVKLPIGGDTLPYLDATGEPQLVKKSDFLEGRVTEAQLAALDGSAYIEAARAQSLALDAHRAPAPAIHCPGTESNRRMEMQPGAVGAVAGSPATFDSGWFTVPDTDPPVTAIICGLFRSNTPSGSGLYGGCHLDLSPVGRVNLLQYGPSSTGDYRRLDNAAFRATYSGQLVRLFVVFPEGDSTTNPVIYLWSAAGQLTDITSSFSFSTLGTAPNWMPTTLDTTYFLGGYNWPEDHAPVARLLNAALSSDDITHLVETGRFPAWATAGGSMVNRIPDVSRNSDFSAGATDWAALGAASSIVSGALDITTGAIGDRIELTPNHWGGNPEAGRKYRVTADISNFSATATIGFQQGASDQFIGAINGDGKVSFEWTSSISGFAQLQIRQTTSGSASLTVDNIVVEELGLIADPIPQPGSYMDDGTRNGIMTRLVGMTPQTSAKTARVPVQLANSSGSAANINLGAIQPANSTLVKVVNRCGATVNSIGTSSGGTQILATTLAADAVAHGSDLSASFNASSSPRNIYANVDDGAAERLVFHFDIED